MSEKEIINSLIELRDGLSKQSISQEEFARHIQEKYPKESGYSRATISRIFRYITEYERDEDRYKNGMSFFTPRQKSRAEFLIQAGTDYLARFLDKESNLNHLVDSNFYVFFKNTSLEAPINCKLGLATLYIYARDKIMLVNPNDDNTNTNYQGILKVLKRNSSENAHFDLSVEKTFTKCLQIIIGLPASVPRDTSQKVELMLGQYINITSEGNLKKGTLVFKRFDDNDLIKHIPPALFDIDDKKINPKIPSEIIAFFKLDEIIHSTLPRHIFNLSKLREFNDKFK